MRIGVCPHVSAILRHDLHRHEPLARVGQRHGDGCGIQIEHAGRIECVAVHSHDVLLVDRRHRPTVFELAEGAVLRRTLEVEIRLCPNEYFTLTGIDSVMIRLWRNEPTWSSQTDGHGMS